MAASLQPVRRRPFTLVKLAFISPRYGAEISTGPEHACRLFAERLARRHEVDVLTTCARDARSWRNELSAGADRVRGVLIRRFAVSQTHEDAATAVEGGTNGAAPLGRSAELEWIRRHGPWSQGLADHLASRCRQYDALVFFSLLNPAAAEGFRLAPERTVVFPCLRPSPTLRFAVWRDLLESVRGVGFFSEAEQHLAHRYIGADPVSEEVVGIGVDAGAPLTYPRHQQDPVDDLRDDDDPAADDPTPEYLSGRGIPFRRQHRLYGPLTTYVGRADRENGFEELFEYFDAYAATGGDATLSLFGAKMMNIPGAPFVRLASVLPDRQRMAAFEAADVALMPSPSDLLGQPLLESLAIGTPVLASARNAAYVELCRASNGGLFYANRNEFVEALRLLMGDHALREGLGQNGREYVQQHCTWDAVITRFERLVNADRRNRRHH
jgi:glycosyltransferase involved in cell wall biosynthesis